LDFFLGMRPAAFRLFFPVLLPFLSLLSDFIFVAPLFVVFSTGL